METGHWERVRERRWMSLSYRFNKSTMEFKKNQSISPGPNKDWFFSRGSAQQANIDILWADTIVILFDKTREGEEWKESG